MATRAARRESVGIAKSIETIWHDGIGCKGIDGSRRGDSEVNFEGRSAGCVGFDASVYLLIAMCGSFIASGCVGLVNPGVLKVRGNYQPRGWEY